MNFTDELDKRVKVSKTDRKKKTFSELTSGKLSSVAKSDVVSQQNYLEKQYASIYKLGPKTNYENIYYDKNDH